ncbi:hypothetical protein ABK040_006764 [Willaertia magna]
MSQNDNKQQEVILFEGSSKRGVPTKFFCVPKPLHFDMEIKFIYECGNDFAMMISQLDDIYLKGKLGEYQYNDFTKIANVPNIKFAGRGENYIIVIDINNCIFGFGDDYGQFGTITNREEEYDNFEPLDPIVEYFKFTSFISINNKIIKFITCGADGVFIVTQDNKILFGGNSDCFTTKCKIISGYKEIDNTPKIEIKDLQCGHYHTIILDVNGNIYGAGMNTNGQLGMENKDITLHNFTKLNFSYKVKQIFCRSNVTFLLTFYNEIYYCGSKHNILYFKKINLPDILQFTSSYLLFANRIGGLIIFHENYVYKYSSSFSDFERAKLDCGKYKYYYLYNFENNNNIFFIGSNIEINSLGRGDYNKQMSFCKRIHSQQTNKSFADMQFYFKQIEKLENKREHSNLINKFENKKRKI